MWSTLYIVHNHFQTIMDDLSAGVLVREGAPLPEDIKYSTEGKILEFQIKSFQVNFNF